MINGPIKLINNGNLVTNIFFKSISLGTSTLINSHNRIPIKSGIESFFESFEVLIVENNWNPFLALITSPLEGMLNSRFSNNVNKTDNTSVGALSISSINTHLPSWTAEVNTPVLHSNVPGFSPDAYVPSNNLASVCSPRWILTIESEYDM